MTPESQRTASGRPAHRARYWLRILLVNACAAIVVLVFMNSARDARGLRDWIVTFGVSLVFGNGVGIPMALLVPVIAPRLRATYGPATSWAILIAAMAVIALAGNIVSIGTLIAVGYLPAAAFGDWFFGSARIAIVITLTFGIAFTLYETLRSRLEETALALRTAERDEADARRVAAEARLAALETRVGPHFLFNTLNSIAALIPQDPAGAERMTGQLASLLRASLDSTSSSLIPLTQELRHVRDYLAIERVRFGDRLRYEIAAPDEVGETRVPRFSLQTLVENGVKFAVSTRHEGGQLRVVAEPSGGAVHLTVEDDGPGFEPTAASDDHGLALVRERLRLSFGERASLHVESRPGRTLASITVPR